jgi:ribosomal protein S18 acetylase RimI-like enzyme
MGAETVTIRRLAPRDESVWQCLWGEYLAFYRAEVPTEVSARSFDRLCTESGDVVGFAAVGEDDAPIGFVHLVFHQSTWSDDPYCYMEDLYVARAGRGLDVGRQLIKAAYEEADRRGASRFYWITQEYNSPARSLYDTVAHHTSFVVYER